MKTGKESNNHYISFLNTLNSYILDQGNFDLMKELTTLMYLEEFFRETLANKKKGIRVYKDFIKYIREVEKNMLAASIYFRERELTFSKKILSAIRNNDAEALSKFKINFKFIQWAIEKSNIPYKKRMGVIFKECKNTRKKIIEQNMPLIINISRLFQIKIKKFSIDSIEFIQTGAEGYISAVDKFVPQGDTNRDKDYFKSMSIGWMSAKLMADFSEGMLKLSVKEKRVLYRANIAIYRHGMRTIGEVLDFVKQAYPMTDVDSLQKIIATGGDLAPLNSTEERQSYADAFFHQQEETMEHQLIDREKHSRLREALSKLSVIERKIVRLKGGLL
jgi:DNA-directed RNA polymerase sigma subunit (sigma70/sigma32)